MRSVRRNVDVMAVLVVAVLLALVIGAVERGRDTAADEAYTDVVAAASDQVDVWLDNHLAVQRALAFESPDADGLVAALAPGYVSFALLLDGDGVVIATYPPRPDIGPGTDLRGAFPHIDAVLDGAAQAFWASDAATTPSGSVAVTAVSGPGTPPTVLTFAFDLGDTTLPRLLGAQLDRIDGAGFTLTDQGTGVTVLRSPSGVGDNTRTIEIDGWELRIGAPSSSIDGLVGSVTTWPGRMVCALVVLAMAVAVAVRRRRLAADAALGGVGDLRLFESASTPAALFDPDDATIVRANESMAELVGVTSSRQLDGAGLDTVLVFDAADSGDEATDAAVKAPISLDDVAGGHPAQAEVRYWMQGEQRWGRVAARRVDRDAATPLVLVEIHDLDEERQRAAMLERQRRALQDMAGRVSHDLRTPITAMIGFAELLHRSPEADLEMRQEWTSRLAANARMLGEHVRDMAEVSADIASRPSTDVRACVARAVRLHDTALHNIGAHVINAVPDATTVAMPELLLRQVIANLVDNAVKYRDRSRPLRVRIAAEIGDDGMVELSVADNGPGIAPDHRERVFASGVRASSALDGSGLGLATCRTLVEDFGGTLGVTDNEPDGARFIIWLPSEAAGWATLSPATPSVGESGLDGSTLDDLPLSILVLGPDRQLVGANRTALDEHGWDGDALPDLAWIDHLPDDGVRAIVLDAVFTGRTESWESATGRTAGVVVPDRLGGGAVLLSWPTVPPGGDEPIPDELTGLPDRIVVRSRLVRALREQGGSASSTAVLSVDLDDFATFNQRKGLSAGDQVLQAVADRLRSTAVDEDAVARQGADEFVVVRPGLSGSDEAKRVADRIRAHVGAPITLADGQVVSVTCSVGVAVAGRDHDPDLLLIAAAQALHEARQADQHTALVEVG